MCKNTSTLGLKTFTAEPFFVYSPIVFIRLMILLKVTVQLDLQFQNQCCAERMPSESKDSLERCEEHQGRARESWCLDDRQLVTL